MDKEPTHCDKCHGSLEQGYSYRYKGDELISALCFKCDREQEFQEYLDTKILRSHFVTNLSLDMYRHGEPPKWNGREAENKKSLAYLVEYGTAAEFEVFKQKTDAYLSYLKVCNQIKEFEDKVWFNGLQKTIRASTKKGVSAKHNGLSVLTWSMCARTMITIEDEHASVTMMTTEDSSSHDMHFRGIEATEEQAIRLINEAILAYQEGNLKFKDDSEVSYCGM